MTTEVIPLQPGPALTAKDFKSDQTVRWCPGCGDYAILASAQRLMPELGIPREKIVFISGIGCSSRFPYYMNTYGIHSIHGRAPTLATGLALADPELTIFVVTGDGDGLSIGGNHTLHVCRRNLDINILLFNNRIYGLTKGQYSPTSLPGSRTKSSPMGSVEAGLNPISIALASEATFVARSVDVQSKHLIEVMRQAVQHKGVSFIEIFQNCNIFNDKAWEHLTAPEIADDRQLHLEHGKPMIFGKEHDKGIRVNSMVPEVVSLADTPLDEILVHDAYAESPHLAFMLSRMDYPDFPVPTGVFRSVEMPTYVDSVMAQVDQAVAAKGKGDLKKLYHASETWTVGGPGAKANGKTNGQG